MTPDATTNWVDKPASPRAAEMRAKVGVLELEIVGLRRDRRAAFTADVRAEIDGKIERAKIAIGRIRAHLRKGVYG